MLGGHPVGIFWDYENCRPSSSGSGYELANVLRGIAHDYGWIKLFKAYLEIPERDRYRSELQSSGVSLTDCPHNGRKNVADQMLMVDMLAFIVDNPAPSTIILISGDRDFAYAVSVLRQRQYNVVLISPTMPGPHISLKSQVSVCLDWTVDVISKITPLPQTPAPTPAPLPQPSPVVTRFRGRIGSVSEFTSSLMRPALVDSGVQCATPPARRILRTEASCQTDTPESNYRTPSSSDSSECLSDPPAPNIPLPDRILSPPPWLPFSESSYSALSLPIRKVAATLARCHHAGIYRPSIAQISKAVRMALPVGEEALYKAFQEAVAGAIEEGVVTSGEGSDGPWVAFNPKWLDIATPPSDTESEEETDEMAWTPSTSSSVAEMETAGGEYAALTSKTPSTHPSTGSLPSPAMTPLCTADMDQTSTQGPSFFPPQPSTASVSTPSLTSKGVPAHFKTLLQCLHHHEVVLGKTRPLKSLMGMEVTSDSTFKHYTAHYKTFRELVDLAEKAGYITTGGTGGSCWITLKTSPQKVLPVHFVRLVRLLQTYRATGALRPTRSVVALALVTQDPSVYTRAGATRFKDFSEMAKDAGIVELGGTHGDAWISLHPDWHSFASA